MNISSTVKTIFSHYRALKIILPILVSLLFLLVVFRFVGLGNTDSSKSQASEETGEIRDLDSSNRPYIGLVPRADGHAIILTVTNHQQFSSLDFEILYQAGSLQQGSIGQIDISKAAYKTEITLGACSKGVCRYDDNVRTGSIKLNGRFKGKQYVAQVPFVLEKITPEASNIVGPENTFDISIQSGSVSSEYYVLIAETLGLPIKLNNHKGLSVAAFSIAPKLNRPAVIKLKNQNIEGLNVNRFDFVQNSWTKIDSQIENGNQFSVDNFGLFAFTQ